MHITPGGKLSVFVCTYIYIWICTTTTSSSASPYFSDLIPNCCSPASLVAGFSMGSRWSLSLTQCYGSFTRKSETTCKSWSCPCWMVCFGGGWGGPLSPFPSLSKRFLRDTLMIKISGCLYSAASGFKFQTVLYYLTKRQWNFNDMVMEVELPRCIRGKYSSVRL